MSVEWQVAICVVWLMSMAALAVGIQALRMQRHMLGLIGKVGGLPLGAVLPELPVQDKHGQLSALPGTVHDAALLIVVSSTCTECERLFNRWGNRSAKITWLFIDRLEGPTAAVPDNIPIYFAGSRAEALRALLLPATPYYFVLDSLGQITDKGFANDSTLQDFTFLD